MNKNLKEEILPNLKRIIQKIPYGDQMIVFSKLDACSPDIKENLSNSDLEVWKLAYNLRRFSENLPNCRYIGYDYHPKQTKLDQGLLPYVKAIRIYAHMSDAQKQKFQEESQRPRTPLKPIYILRGRAVNQNG